MSREAGTYAIFNTSEGTIVCRLFEKEAPKTVTNFPVSYTHLDVYKRQTICCALSASMAAW